MPTDKPDGPALEEEERKEEYKEKGEGMWRMQWVLSEARVRIRTQELRSNTSISPLCDLASFPTHLLSHLGELNS